MTTSPDLGLQDGSIDVFFSAKKKRKKYVSTDFEKAFHFVVTPLKAKVYSYLCVVRRNESSVPEVDRELSA